MNQSTQYRVSSILLFGLLISVVCGQPPIDQVSAALDKDSDGTLSADELGQAVASLLALDTNSDGKLTFEEILPAFPGGPGGGRRGPRMEKRELIPEYDKDGDGRLNRDERTKARETLGDEQQGRGFGRGRGPGGRGRDGEREPATPGPRVVPADVDVYSDADLYDSAVFRTLFIDFEHDDWPQEMAAFKDSDVDVPATLTVDGKVYPNVGVHFRGMSSFMMVPAEYKRSLNLALDYVDGDQHLYGYRTLNLLNGNGDPSMMSSALYSYLASRFISVPKVNFVKVVINGESWGVFVNSQQFNKDFVKEHFGTSKGARWKVRGNPGADGGLRYLGDDLAEYKQRFQLKSKDSEKSWNRLIALCKTLEETPADQLERELNSIIDVDELLWFLALDVAVVNSDGYWTRASDYSLYLDNKNRFHIVPHDMNEAFHGAQGDGPGGFGGPPPGFGDPPGFARPPGFGPPDGGESPPDAARLIPRGRGAGGGPNHGSVDLDPLVNIDNPRMPLHSKVLAVPKWRQQYLQNIRVIAEQMNWAEIGPFVSKMRNLIKDEVKADTKKLSSFAAFEAATQDTSSDDEPGLRHFFEARRKFLLEYPDIAELSPRTEIGLVINEIMADNTSIKDADGNFDDWIELFNASNEAIDLSDISLSDDAKKLQKWTFPKDTKLGPGEYLIVWADGDNSAETELHASFKLAKNGETLFLSRPNIDGDGHTIIDQLRFARHEVHESLGRTKPQSNVCFPLKPTPGKANQLITRG